MTYKSQLLSIGLGLLLFFGVVIGVGLFWQKSPTNTNPNSQPTVSNLVNNSPQSSVSPTTAPPKNRSQDTSMSIYQAPPEPPAGWSYFYDGALGYLAAYPSEFRVSPAANTESGESAFYSIANKNNAATGPVPVDELKIAVVYRPAGNHFFSQTDIPSTAEQMMIDGFQAYQYTSPNDTVLTTAVAVGNGNY